MSTAPEQLVILGAGHAGATLAFALRQNGWSGSITLIGDEACLPYQRPPLSKAWLSENLTPEALLLKPADAYERSDITLTTGCKAVGIDRSARRVTLEDGSTLSYDRLVLATGSSARSLPGQQAGLSGVLSLRGLVDADALKTRLAGARHLVVIGGGYIGLEVAATARKAGLTVTVLEREQRLLARVASPGLSHHVRDLHQAHCVEIVTGAELAGLVADDTGSRVCAASLKDGTTLPADLVLVGIGAIANSAIAIEAGLDCRNGAIIVDRICQTSDPAIFAIGDVTWRPFVLHGGSGQLESVQNALEQARILAAHLTGRPLPAPEVPWFWSDQYDSKLQSAGLLTGTARTIERHGTNGGRAWFHLDPDGAVRAVEAVNAAPEFMSGRMWIGKSARPDPVQLANPTVPLKEVQMTSATISTSA